MFPPNIVQACTQQVILRPILSKDCPGHSLQTYHFENTEANKKTASVCLKHLFLLILAYLGYIVVQKYNPYSFSRPFPHPQFKTTYGKRVVHIKVTVNDSIFNLTNGSHEITKEELIPVLGTVNGINALGLVMFSMCFGLIIGSMKEQGQPLKDFFDCLNEAIMRLVAIIMW